MVDASVTGVVHFPRPRVVRPDTSTVVLARWCESGEDLVGDVQHRGRAQLGLFDIHTRQGSTPAPVALFRGSSRLEYQNQNVKLLRAVQDEVTRAAYRLLWVDDSALEIFTSDPAALCIAVLTNPEGTHALPIRHLLTQQAVVDRETGMLYLELVVGPFVDVGDGFDTSVDAWHQGPGAPPECFVTSWSAPETQLDEVRGQEALATWRRAIDFITEHWDFDGSIFFRPVESLEGEQSGPVVTDARQGKRTTLSLASYNPHMVTANLDQRRLSIQQEGALADIADPPQLERDGFIEISIRCLEPGDLQLRVSVEPDPHLSTYIPFRLHVEQADEIHPTRTRVMGHEWQACLDGLATQLQDDPDLQYGVLELLERVFPKDPYLLFHRGRIHYERQEFAEARRLFGQALAVHASPRILAWDLFAALRRGDTQDASDVVARLDLSHHDLFDRLVDVVRVLPETTALTFINAAGLVFGEDKTNRLYAAASDNLETEEGLIEVAMALATTRPTAAYEMLLEPATQRTSWHRARELLLDLAGDVGRRHEVANIARQLLLADDEGPARTSQRLRSFGHLLDPRSRLDVLLENAGRLLGATGDEAGASTDAGVELLLEAFDGAMRLGDLLVAEEILVRAYANAAEELIVAELESRRERLQRTLDVMRRLEEGSAEYQHQLVVNLRQHAAGLDIVILGGATPREDILELARDLGVRDATWLTSTPQSPISEARLQVKQSDNLLIVAFEEKMGHLSTGLRDRLKRNGIPVLWAHNVGVGNFLDALRRHFEVEVTR